MLVQGNETWNEVGNVKASGKMKIYFQKTVLEVTIWQPETRDWICRDQALRAHEGIKKPETEVAELIS